MRIFFACMTAACALAAAAPAAAQYGNANAGGTVAFENRLAQIDSRIQAGISSGAIDRIEAASLRAQMRDLRRTYRLYARNGISQSEQVDLQTRVRGLRQDLRLADGGRQGGVYAGQRYDRNGDIDPNGSYDRYGNRIDVGVYAGQRYDRYGRPDANGTYDRDGNRIDVGVYAGQRYDRYGRPDANGTYDRDGNRIDVGVYGQGGPYEPVDEYCVDRADRGGLGGIIDSIFGGGDECDRAGLTVGSRVTGNLGAVPSQYRWRYRDGNGVYYRSDGRNIYQIDARTQTVLRVYDIDR